MIVVSADRTDGEQHQDKTVGERQSGTALFAQDKTDRHREFPLLVGSFAQTKRIAHYK